MKANIALALCMGLFANSAKAGDAAERNLTRSLKFLAVNAMKPDVIVRPFGLQYRVLETSAADGQLIQLGDFVCTHAEGRLVDGTPFWAQVAPESAIAFKSDKVIKGWGEVLGLMRPGDVWEVYIPPELAYGDEARGDVIGPNDALVFKLWFYGGRAEAFEREDDCRDELATKWSKSPGN